MRIVLDTNMVVSALRSKQGASYALIACLPSKKFQPVLSIPLYFEYLDVLSRPGMLPEAIQPENVLVFCRYMASISHKQDIYFLWRPFLPDPQDDLVLEAAVAANAEYIVTYNIGHFRSAKAFGITPIKPINFLILIGEKL